MLHLMAWNGFYGFRAYEVYIAPGESIEEKKKIKEEEDYKCWILNDEELKEYEED